MNKHEVDTITKALSTLGQYIKTDLCWCKQSRVEDIPCLRCKAVDAIIDCEPLLEIDSSSEK